MKKNQFDTREYYKNYFGIRYVVFGGQVFERPISPRVLDSDDVTSRVSYWIKINL